MIIFQITKYKSKVEIYSKKIYENHIKNKIKKKFEKLYEIKIVEIYFWFILSNECEKNEDTCEILDEKNIKYIFYSHKKKCFYKERSINKVDDIEFFYGEKSKIYPLKKENEEIRNFNPAIYQFYFNQIEEEILLEMEKIENDDEINKKINYEKIRNKIVPNSIRIIIKNEQKEIIENILKNISIYSNNIQLLYLFCIPIAHLKFLINDENLIFIFKFKNKYYFYNKTNIYQIVNNSKEIKISIELNNITQYLNEEIVFDERKVNLEEIKDITDIPILYMFRIYFIGDRLNKKSKKNKI